MLAELQPQLAPARENAPTSSALLLIFVKPQDMHSLEAIEKISELQHRDRELFANVSVGVIVSRIGPGEEFTVPSLPEDWRIIRDESDAYYKAYGIIATPSTAVISAGHIAGFHPGYSPALLRLIQRDLLRVIRGADEMQEAAPEMSLEIKMANRFAERQLWDRALEYYQKAAEKEPLSFGVLLDMARAHAELQQFEEAEEILKIVGNAPGADQVAERIRELRAASGPAKAPPVH
jgi:tetratricopeptide (TPR) repeat protein